MVLIRTRGAGNSADRGRLNGRERSPPRPYLSLLHPTRGALASHLPGRLLVTSSSEVTGGELGFADHETRILPRYAGQVWAGCTGDPRDVAADTTEQKVPNEP